MNAALLTVAALLLAALGCALLAVLALTRMTGERRSARTLAQVLAGQEQARAAAAASGAAPPESGAAGPRVATGAAAATRAPARPRWSAWLDRLADTGMRWLDTPLGRQLVSAEERQLLERCGFVDVRSRGLFLIARLACASALPVLVLWWHELAGGATPLWQGFVALVLGFMLPKFALARRAKARADMLMGELPMFVDLLRLLQGVGLSLDQSLQVMINEFRRVLPVLASELVIAQRQFTAGRTREQSLQRLSTSYDDEDLRAVMHLIVQLDRHGGAVQEPLKQFGDRLREVRRATLRERIGQLTVKMTGVMVVTLLPALLIVTAGPGLLAVLKSLSTLHR